jgi:hypothetical protein
MGSVKIGGQSLYFKLGAKQEKWQRPDTRSVGARDKVVCSGAGDSREASLRCGAVGAKIFTPLHLAQHENCQL